VQTYSGAGTGPCTSAKNFLQSVPAGSTKIVVRVTGGCTLEFDNNALVRVYDNLAIVSDGGVRVAQRTTFRSMVAEAPTLFLIVPYPQACAGTAGDLSLGNNTEFTGVNVVAYSPCTVTFANRNVGNGGQIVGGEVDVTNQFSIAYRPILIPGLEAVVGHRLDVAFVREVVGA
ncbi:MAG: hypothetical protein ACRD0M_05825, partial [Acidimicrobiales bacterium]